MADDKNSNSGNLQSHGQSQDTTTPNEPPKVDQGLVDLSQRSLTVDQNLVDIIQENKE